MKKTMPAQNWKSTLMGWSLALSVVPVLPPTCSSQEAVVLVRDGIGDPCVPGDETFSTFSGYSLTEVNIDTQFAGCKTGMCLVNHFQGRVTCPGGQSADDIRAGAGTCMVTEEDGGVQPVSVPVAPQCANRPADVAVSCTCSCAGDDPALDYCACPDGFVCKQLLASGSRLGSLEFGNSFCIKAGTDWDGQTGCQ